MASRLGQSALDDHHLNKANDEDEYAFDQRPNTHALVGGLDRGQVTIVQLPIISLVKLYCSNKVRYSHYRLLHRVQVVPLGKPFHRTGIIFGIISK